MSSSAASAAVNQSGLCLGKGYFQGCCTLVWSPVKASFGVRVDTSKAFWFQQPYWAVHQNSIFTLRGRKASLVHSVINIPLFPSPSKAVTTSQSLSICACTPVSLWKLLHKWHMLPSAPRESLQTGTWKTSYTCPNTNATLGFVPCSAEIWAEGSCVWQEK